MDRLQHRLHAGLLRTSAPNWRQLRHSPHLHQGSLDGASAVYAVATALVVLGVTTKRDVKDMRFSGSGLLEKMWSKALELFFAGADKQELLALLETVGSYLTYEIKLGSTSRVASAVALHIASGDLAIVGLDLTTGLGHWVLAVGIEELVVNRKRTAIGILCLDPSEPTPLLAQFNSRIELDADVGGGQLGYRSADGVMRCVTCNVAWLLAARRSARKS